MSAALRNSQPPDRRQLSRLLVVIGRQSRRRHARFKLFVLIIKHINLNYINGNRPHFETIYGRLHACADQLTTTNVVSEDKGWGINRTKVYIYSGFVLGIAILLYMWSPSVLKHSETNTTNWGRLFRCHPYCTTKAGGWLLLDETKSNNTFKIT